MMSPFRTITKALRAIGARLGYFSMLRHREARRWLAAAIDYQVLDHMKAWTELSRSDSAWIHPTVFFQHARNIEIGAKTRIQMNCALWASPNSKIRIGDYSGLGPGTVIFSSNHRFVLGEPYFEQPWDEKSVTLGRDVWVGSGCIILPGVTIGDGCVIAAGSVVTKDIPANSLAAGVPARVLRTREIGRLSSPLGHPPSDLSGGSS